MALGIDQPPLPAEARVQREVGDQGGRGGVRPNNPVRVQVRERKDVAHAGGHERLGFRAPVAGVLILLGRQRRRGVRTRVGMNEQRAGSGQGGERVVAVGGGDHLPAVDPEAGPRPRRGVAGRGGDIRVG